MRNFLITIFSILTLFIGNTCKKETKCDCELDTTSIIKVFRPDPIQGIFATIFSLYPDSTLRNSSKFFADTWTWTYLGLPYTGTHRSLIKFDLSVIPINTNINNATLLLYHTDPTYSDSSNTAILQKIIEPWEDSTVTWNNQPQVTTNGQIILPGSQVQQDYTADITAMVQDMISNPETNFGFMIRLETEVRPRGIFFGSCRNNSSNYWPMLIIEM